MLPTEKKVIGKAGTVCHEEAATIDSSPDLFDKLPLDLVDHIVSLMTPKALISTRILAKKWLQLSPVVHFSIRSDREFRKALLSFATQAVKRKSVSINLQYFSNEIDKYVEEFVSLAAKYNVYEVSLRCPIYKLPPTLFGYKSLLVLRLEGCHMDYLPNASTGRLDYLQVLSFSNAHLGAEFVNNLIRICPNISHLSVKQCTGLGRGEIYLRPFQRLKNVQICGTSYGGIVIDAPDLCFLKYTSSETSNLIHLGSCREVEMFNSYDKIRLRIAVDIYFSNCPFLSRSNYITIWVDPSSFGSTQNMCSFRYTRYGIKLFSFSLKINPQQEVRFQKVRFQSKYSATIDTCFFKKLRWLVETFSQTSVLSFRFDGKLLKEAVNIGELRNSCLSPVCRIKHLKLELIYASPFLLRYSNVLIDALLFCCYPETLTLKLSKYQNVFIEALLEKLKPRGKGWKKCCKVTDVKCWRHFFQDVEIERMERTNKYGEEYEMVNLRFQWM